MSQYDAAAEPLWRCFDTSAVHAAFHTRPPQTDLFERNIALNEWQRQSEGFNFAREDRAPEQALNQVIWFACHGISMPFPAPVHAAFVKINEKDDD